MTPIPCSCDYASGDDPNCLVHGTEYGDPPPSPASLSTGEHARAICTEVADLVNGPRNVDYGDALDNFTETAALWSPILGVEVTAEQVALCMAQLKIARLIHNTGHRDSWVDGVGYLALGGGIALRRDTSTGTSGG